MPSENIKKDKILENLMKDIGSKLSRYDELVTRCYRISTILTGKGKEPRGNEKAPEEKSFVNQLEIFSDYLTLINNDLEQSISHMDELV